MNVAFLCLGGNMGDRLAYINDAKRLINSQCGKITAQSSIYETQAWGTPRSGAQETKQPDYYNQCVKLETGLEAKELLKILLVIEAELGRERSGSKNESRTIDIDILFYNDEKIIDSNCEIPHPRLHLRQFVLKPMKEIAPEWMHPVLQKSITTLLRECPDTFTAKKIPNDVHLR
jgi:2-amino-4-hydroxy-6-hydroxymethyldihydropteridine diphosphokinase